ncbi:MAG: hypothetical protein ABR511_03820 [Acidimicrobiales bacterium]
MASTFSRPGKGLTTALAVVIVVVLGGGIFGAVTNSGGESSADRARKQQEAAQKQADAERRRQEAADKAAGGAAAADQKALDLITANQQTCNTRYLPEAEARAKTALDQLKEQRAALDAVQAQLPPGRAKDALSSQIGPDFDASTDLINAELRAARTRCQLAATVYQLTH